MAVTEPFLESHLIPVQLQGFRLSPVMTQSFNFPSGSESLLLLTRLSISASPLEETWRTQEITSNKNREVVMVVIVLGREIRMCESVHEIFMGFFDGIES